MPILIDTGTDTRAGSEAIEASSIGAEFLGWEGFTDFQARHDVVPFTHVRWPGGIPVEDGIDTNGDRIRDTVFDLNFDNLVDWRRGTPAEPGPQREGIREVMAYAVAHDMSLAMVLPTARYVEAGIEGGEAGAIRQARADVRQFIERLARGEFGAIPDRLILEIGSEYYATDVWANYNADPDDNRDGTRHC